MITVMRATDHDDYLSGRFQGFDIWRYRIYGLSSTDPAGQPSNTFYDLVLPRPATDFYGGGSNYDWYQPTHENGNILRIPRRVLSSRRATSAHTKLPVRLRLRIASHARFPPMIRRAASSVKRQLPTSL
ncbi:MAG: hypothetical protein M3388_09560 [Acidobacteriota bacterium]|nr:hypothetical protein [Acidobacteriota bacterium]